MPVIAKVFSKLSYYMAGFQHDCVLICLIDTHLRVRVGRFICAGMGACCQRGARTMLWFCKLVQACLIVCVPLALAHTGSPHANPSLGSPSSGACELARRDH